MGSDVALEWIWMGFGWNGEGMGNFWRKCCEKY